MIVFVSVFSVIATAVFSVFSQIDLSISALGAGSKPSFVWAGAEFVIPSKVSYAGGSGSVQDPYLVSNGDQLYKMVYEQGRTNFGNGSAAYFELTNDIYLNDISNFAGWTDTTAGLNDWFAKSELYSKEFMGHIDGAGFTVYGFYTSKNSDVSGTSSAFIPIVSQNGGCTVKNFNMANAYIKSNKESAVIAGQVKGDSQFSGIIVHDVKLNAPYSSGMATQVWNCNVSFTDCMVYNISGTNATFGIVGRKFDGYKQYTVSLKNCISLGYHPASYTYNTTGNKENWVSYVYENVLTDRITSQNGSIGVDTTYTKADGTQSNPSATGSIHSITANDIKVDTNDNPLSENFGFDFINVWRATGEFPVLRNSDYWEGVNSGTNYDLSIFNEGKGTKESPYLITNGDQLYAMVLTGGESKYFTLANDIYLNDVKSVDITDLPTNELNDWTVSSKILDKSFSGHFDGGYHTVYGLYTASGTAALIPNASNSEICNLNIAKSMLSGKNVGGIIGEVQKGKTVKVTGCSVYDTILSGTDCSGGVVATGKGNAELERSFSYDLIIASSDKKGGLLGDVKGSGSKLTDCYSAGNYPVGASASLYTASNVKNVYTDISSVGVFTKLGSSKLVGENALDDGNMKFSSKTYWQITTSYPIMRIIVEDANAAKIWDGSSDDSWKSTDTGDSAEHPYIISTPAQLYNMISSTTSSGTDYEGKYFKLANDIYLNSVVYSDWYKLAENGWINSAKTYFKGNFDGGNHTVYGLYINSDKENLGLFPTTYGNAVIKNLKIVNAYIIGKSSSNQYAGAVIGRTLSGKTTVSKCTVDYNVLIGAKTAGGIIGCCGYNSTLTDKSVIEHCSFVGSFTNNANGVAPSYKGGLVGNCLGAGVSGKGTTVTASDSFTTAEKAFDNGKATCSTANPVYQSGSTNISSSLVKADAQKMFGSDAITVMPKLDWGSSWLITSFYPEINTKDYAVWSGGIASSYESGNGTENNPYIIKTAEQLAKMVKDGGKNASGKAAFFKVQDGVDVLYLNDVAGMNLKEAVNYLTNDAAVKEWLYNSATFTGNFNGNGVTIYGIYNNSESKKGGLISSLGAGAFVYNVNLKNCAVVSTDNTTYAGVLASSAAGSQVIVKSVSVTDCYIRGRWAAAVVGNATSSILEISNCLVRNVDIDYNGKGITNGGGAGGAAALVTDGAWGTATVTINDCLTVGIYPVCYYRPNPQSARFILTDVYTDVDLKAQSDYSALSGAAKEKFSQIKQLNTAKITGKTNPEKNMNFDWEKIWATTESYPILQKYILNNGTVGAVWSGGVADCFMGSGTKADPFIVDTAERLVKMVKSPVSGGYYLITQDIRLNNINSSEWYKNTGLNVWNTDVPEFTANVSGYNPETGKTATVYGLYIPEVKSGEYAGLIPSLAINSSVKNITLANAYFKGTTSTKDTDGSTIGAIVGVIGEGASNTVITGCTVENSVIIENSGFAGGILGSAVGAGVIADCVSKVSFKGSIELSGGIVAEAVGACNIMTSYSVGNYVSGKGGRVINVYSDTDQKLSPFAGDLAVVLLTTEQMTGNNAENYMTGFDFNNVWNKTESYPEICGETPPFDGTPGEVWTGLTAQNYAGGTGTESDPYLIATGEQLYKLVTSVNSVTKGKYYKLINDIKLNDVYSENWDNKTGLNPWYSSKGGNNSFAGHFDGDYHIVSGIYYEANSGSNFYAGLFPLIDQGTVIENTGITDCYISVSTVLPQTYAACFAGNTTNYGYKTDVTGEKVLMSPEEYEANGGKIPVIRNCFADHTTYCEARYAGGIVCGVQNFINVDNCFFTGYADGGDAIQMGAIVGDAWGMGSRITNCYSAPINMCNFSGNIKILNAKNDEDVYIRNCYALSYRTILNVVILPFDREKYGGTGVKDYAVGLDWDNIWATVEGGTPVLRGFDKNGHILEEFSYKGTYSSTITFVTNAEGINIEPITGEVLSYVKLPTPKRYGYTFGGWYVYSELDIPYDRDYMPYRDLTLYAKWTLDGVYQTFENYPNTVYDVGDDYAHYRPGVRGYNVNNVHAGGKSMHRLGETSENSDFLINYEDTLKVGSEYVMTYWMLTDTENASVKLTLNHNTWPDIEEPIAKSETILKSNRVPNGEWKQYTYKFVASTPWVSITTNGDTSLYFDDIMIAPTGLSSLSFGSGNGILGGTIPKTGENEITLKICFSAFAFGFVTISLLKRKIKS